MKPAATLVPVLKVLKLFGEILHVVILYVATLYAVTLFVTLFAVILTNAPWKTTVMKMPTA